jgi:hypothetical protein
MLAISKWNKSIAVLYLIICIGVHLVTADMHAECGESPTQKYRDIAKTRGNKQIY